MADAGSMTRSTTQVEGPVGSGRFCLGVSAASFYGYDLDVACRLLDSTKLKRALKERTASPLALVISDEIYDLVVAEEIHNGMAQQGYLHGALFRPLCRVRVGNLQRRGWVHLPAPADLDHSATIPRPWDEVTAHVAWHRSVSGPEEPRPGPG
jgi:hypothetical protein